MASLIEILHLLDERGAPGTAAWNMGMDEALLRKTSEAVLRVYRWEDPALSFGYFLPWEQAVGAAVGKAVMRRWTGGGMVEHGEDFTWSLIVPHGSPVSRLRPVDSYAAIHGALGEALRATGVHVDLVGRQASVPAGGFCFEAPAPGDLLAAGRKIAGAGQRRCRQGLLHQGSLRGVPLPGEFPQLLAEALGRTVLTFPPAEVPVEAARDLVRNRYGTLSWLQKR